MNLVHLKAHLHDIQAKQGPYCLDRGPIFPSTDRASSVSKLFIIWHSVSDSRMHFRWLALKMFVFFIYLWNFGKISIFLASSGSFNVKNDNWFTVFFFAVLAANFEFVGLAPKQKYMETVRTAKSWPRKNQSEHRDLALGLLYHKNV